MSNKNGRGDIFIFSLSQRGIIQVSHMLFAVEIFVYFFIDLLYQLKEVSFFFYCDKLHYS